MNAAALFKEQVKRVPNHTALWTPGKGGVTFMELEGLASRFQSRMRQAGLGPGDTVLLFDTLSPRLYAAIIGLMGMGVAVVLVEPWLSVDRINHVIEHIKPKAFLSGTLGAFWGLRVPEIRKIPQWIRMRAALKEVRSELICDSLDGNLPGIITFTSGTTGNPKGMVRTHRYLTDQHRILSQSLELEKYAGTDLCIFANFALANLASGRGTVLFASSWKPKDFKALDYLPTGLQPESLTCGPAFLMNLMRYSRVRSLKSIHVGGALSDCDLFERAFHYWPEAHWSHLYGSTEAEPVAVSDAKRAFQESRKKGLFQMLYLGKPIREIKSRLDPDTLWISGPHVCPKYIANDEENQRVKHLDGDGILWHRMGDRIKETGFPAAADYAWWYGGRESQEAADFDLEQRIYSMISSSAAFVEVGASGEKVLYCQRGKERSAMIHKHFPEIAEIKQCKIVRDARHRARIDRAASKKGVQWSQKLG